MTKPISNSFTNSFLKTAMKKLKKEYFKKIHKAGCHLSNFVLEVLMEDLDRSDELDYVTARINYYSTTGRLDLDQVKIAVDILLGHNPVKEQIDWSALKEEQLEYNKEVLDSAQKMVEDGDIQQDTFDKLKTMFK